MMTGIKMIHSRGAHPQTLGKTERLNRTYKYDYILREKFNDFEKIQGKFNEFKHEYNNIRPHEALNFKRPVEVYKKSKREYTGKLTKIQYPEGATTRKVTHKGVIYYQGKYYFISESLIGHPVLLKELDGCLDVYFMNTLLRTVKLKNRS